MCFGGGGSQQPAAPVQTPAVPVDQISAGQPTVTVKQNAATNPDPVAPRTAAPAEQGSAGSGISNLGM